MLWFGNKSATLWCGAEAGLCTSKTFTTRYKQSNNKDTDGVCPPKNERAQKREVIDYT